MQILPFDDRKGLIWFNGDYIEWSNAKVHVLNHGLHYGSCVFEGLRIYEGQIFKLNEHIQRLYKSASILDLEIPYNEKVIIDKVTKQISFDTEYYYDFDKSLMYKYLSDSEIDITSFGKKIIKAFHQN